MKKYFYTLSLLGLIIYSCKTQTSTTVAKSENNPVTVPIGSNDNLAKGETLYNQRCGKCHELYATNGLSAKNWKPIIDAMAPKAKLTDEETNWVLAYVTQNAKK